MMTHHSNKLSTFGFVVIITEQLSVRSASFFLVFNRRTEFRLETVTSGNLMTANCRFQGLENTDLLSEIAEFTNLFGLELEE